MAWILVRDCEIYFEGKKSDCIAFWKRHKIKWAMRLLEISKEEELLA